MTALSVSISARTSPFSTLSPGCLSHLAIVPSSMVSLRRGIDTSGMGDLPSSASGSNAVERLVDDLDEMAGVGQRGQLQRLGVGERDLGHRDPADRGVQVVEGALLDGGRDLGADAVAQPVLLHDDGLAGLADGLD